MSSEVKRSKCLEKVNHIEYRALPSLLTSGRYIRSLRYLQGVTSDPQAKSQYEDLINKYLTKHLVLLQEALLSSESNSEKKQISKNTFERIKQLSTSQYTVSEENFSLVDVEGLKKMQTIKRAVILPSPLVLPCKIKSENQQYKFNTQIIMTPNNVLAYTRGEFEFDDSKTNINHNTLLTKIGNGIIQNELVKKIPTTAQSKGA